jgi:LacI family transcriptional regulator, kdg operon repressor
MRPNNSFRDNRMSSLPATPEGRDARVTIDDVARLAGVSKATVSRFLNHRTTRLTPEIAARVEKAVAELAYMPSPMAQALKRGRSRLLGLVVADITNPFSVAVLRGAENAAQQAGYLVMLFNLGNAGERECEGIEALASYQVEGFILNTLGVNPMVAGALARLRKPAVLVDRKLADVPADFVSLDNADAVHQAVTHLLDNGWRELLFVTEPMAGVSPRIEREAAFRQALLPPQKGVNGQVLEVSEGDDATLDQALRDLAKRAGRRPKAVLASNGRSSLRVVTALARLGWELGRDIGFAGIDETEWAPLIGPGLTTVEQPTDEIGRLAVGCLLERLGGQHPAPRQVLLTGRLKPRGSSQRPSP